jgi:hypothetical protein
MRRIRKMRRIFEHPYFNEFKDFRIINEKIGGPRGSGGNH